MQHSWNTSQLRSPPLTRLNKAGTNRRIALHPNAFRLLRGERRVRAITTQEIRHRRELVQSVREPVRDDQRGKVDLLHPWTRRDLDHLVRFVDRACDGGTHVSEVALPCEVEGRIGVLREPREEQGEEGVGVLGDVFVRQNLGAVVRVGVPCANGLVKEDHVRDVGP